MILPLLVLSSQLSPDASVTLRIVHVTDVYTLENLPSLKTLIDKHKEDGITTISILTGDFMMPYLLSTVDKGVGMMSTINRIPIDFLTWGNHEKDLPHSNMLAREREFNGVWINTNMQSHESFTNSSCQKDYHMIELRNNDHVRKIALLGILSNSPSLYPPGSFHGAIIEDPWETMYQYMEKLQNQVDMILPLCHLYEAQDERTAAEFNFPLVLGGHDHHVVNRVMNGTLVLKPGSDAHFANIVDIRWNTARGDDSPVIKHHLVRVADYPPDENVKDHVKKAYSVLEPLHYTQLDFIPAKYRPLSSLGARAKRVTVATYLGGEICAALPKCDAFIAKGGNIRGGRDYRNDEHFTLEMLRSELEDVDVYVTQIPGSILRVGLRETWNRPGTGWFQYDAGVVVDSNGFVESIAGEPLDDSRMYTIVSMEDFFRSRDGPSIGKYYEDEPTRKPPRSHQGVYNMLLQRAAAKWWDVLWSKMDVDANGAVNVHDLDRDDILQALRNECGLQTYDGEYTLVDHILSIASGGESNSVRVTPEKMNSVYARSLLSTPQYFNSTEKEACAEVAEK
jgi:hypothetical protein